MLSQCLARHEDHSDETLWPEACAFFSHDPALRSDTDEVHIAGCKLTLLPWQAVDVFAYFRITIGGKGLTPSHGALCAHPMGQGKSRIAMAIIAVRRLCFALLEHAEGAGTENCHITASSACSPVRQRGMITCPCAETSFSRRICQSTDNSASLFVVPASVLTETYEKCMGFFLSNIKATFGEADAKLPGISIYKWRDQRQDITTAVKGELGWDKKPVGSVPSKHYRAPNSKKKLDKQEIAECLRAVGGCAPKVLLRPANIGGSPASSMLAIVSRQSMQWEAHWESNARGHIQLTCTSKKQTNIPVSAIFYSGLVVVDAVHQYATWNSKQAQALLRMVGLQEKQPQFLMLTGTPVSKSLEDVMLISALLTGKHTTGDLRKITAELSSANRELKKASSPAAVEDGVPDKTSADEKSRGHKDKALAKVKKKLDRFVPGYIHRADDSTFLGVNIMPQRLSTNETIECPIDARFQASMTAFTRTAAAGILKDYKDMEDKPRTESGLEAWALKYNGLRNLALSIQMPGYLESMKKRSIDTLVEGFAACLRKSENGADKPSPADAAYGEHLPDDMAPVISDILLDNARLRELKAIFEKAYIDKQSYPNNEDYVAYCGPKNVVVLTDLPIMALWLKVWAETYLDKDRYQSTLIHSGQSVEQRNARMDWFGDFYEGGDDASKEEHHRGGRKGVKRGAKRGAKGGAVDNPRVVRKHTKVLFTTYHLCGTGLDKLKAANYLVQFSVIKNTTMLRQCAGRINRRGQPLESYVFRFQTSDHPLEKLTIGARDQRTRMWEGGFLREMRRWAEEPDVIDGATT